MAETTKKKRGMLSSFTILLLLLAIVAIVTVVVSGFAPGEVSAAKFSDFFTAPVKGFADALPVCLSGNPGPSMRCQAAPRHRGTSYETSFRPTGPDRRGTFHEAVTCAPRGSSGGRPHV